MKKLFLVFVLFSCCFFSKAQENVVYVAPGETFNWIVPAENGDTIVYFIEFSDVNDYVLDEYEDTVYTNVIPIVFDCSKVRVRFKYLNGEFVYGCFTWLTIIRREDD